MNEFNAVSTIVSHGDNIRGWAKYYSAHGFVVAPAAGKVPVANWGQIRANDQSLFPQPNWFGPSSSANIVILTGNLSGVFVVDVDVADEKLGAHSLMALEAKYGALPATLRATTGTGGRHYYFKYPSIGPDEKVATIANAFKDEGLPDIDIRGDGGVIVAPPSIHPVTLRPYLWDADLAAVASALSLIAEAPQWLLEKVVKKTRKVVTDVPAGAFAHLLGAPAIAKMLSNACSRIAQAPNGEQERTLFAMSKDMGKLIGAGALTHDEAHAALLVAGHEMKEYNPSRPWTKEQLIEKIDLSISKGIDEPADLSWVRKMPGNLLDSNLGMKFAEDQLNEINDEIVTSYLGWSPDLNAEDLEGHVGGELPRLKLLPSDWQADLFEGISEKFPHHAALIAVIKANNQPAIAGFSAAEGRGFDHLVSAEMDSEAGGTCATAKAQQPSVSLPGTNGFDLVSTWDVAMPREVFVTAVRELQEKVSGRSLRELSAIFGQLKTAFAGYSKEADNGFYDAVITLMAAGGPGAPPPWKASDLLGKSADVIKKHVKERRVELMRRDVADSMEASEKLVGYDTKPYFINEEGVWRSEGESNERVSTQRIWVDSICRNMVPDGVDQVRIGLEEDTGGIAMRYLPYAASVIG